MTLLATEALSKRFAGVHAVNGVDFALDRGEIRALIGPNGAGKTTFVSLLCGRIAPSAGRVIFEGKDITDLPAHRRIRLGMAYTFQITSIYPGLPVLENAALAARRRQHDPEAAEMEARDALDRVGMLERAGELAGDLSYGHQRLLEIAMGIAQKPRLLILDEPTQGLADAEIAGTKALMRELHHETTILLIEHNMSLVMEMASRVTVMDRGRILHEGTPAEVRANAAVQAAYLGTG